jgi:hypothetical protein
VSKNCPSQNKKVANFEWSFTQFVDKLLFFELANHSKIVIRPIECILVLAGRSGRIESQIMTLPCITCVEISSTVTIGYKEIAYMGKVSVHVVLCFAQGKNRLNGKIA